MTWVERIFYMLGVVILAFFLMREGCKDPVVCPDVKPVVVTGSHDTVYVPVPGPVIPAGKANKVTVSGRSAVKVFPAPPVTGPDSLSGAEWLIKPEDVEQCATRPYQDTLRFGEYGFAVVKDTVLGRILRRSFSYNITSRTQIIREQEAKRFKLYAGVEFISPLNYGGAALIGQFKNESMIKIATGKMWNNSWQVGIGFYIPIKLRK